MVDQIKEQELVMKSKESLQVKDGAEVFRKKIQMQ